MARGACVLAAAALLPGCAGGMHGGSSGGGDQWTATVLRQLSTVDGIARNEGMARMGNPLVGSITTLALIMLLWPLLAFLARGAMRLVAGTPAGAPHP